MMCVQKRGLAVALRRIFLMTVCRTWLMRLLDRRCHHLQCRRHCPRTLQNMAEWASISPLEMIGGCIGEIAGTKEQAFVGNTVGRLFVCLW